jgi:dUTP pyrophosphatase
MYKLWIVDETGKNRYSSCTPDNTNAGFDLYTAQTWRGEPGDDAYLLDLGIRAMMTRTDTGEQVHFWLAPRSSIYKTGHMMANSMGVVDRTYRGILKAPVIPIARRCPGFQVGDRHFQIVAPDMGWIAEVAVVDYLPTSVRGEGGFGSTGR